MCCRMPMIMLSRVSFLSSSSLDCELMSVTKARIQKICYLTQMLTSFDISTRNSGLMLWVTAGARFSSLSSMRPLSSQTEASTSSILSSRMALLISLRICWQSQPTLTRPYMMSTMFLEHSGSKPMLNMVTKSWKMALPRMNLRLMGLRVRLRNIKVIVLRSSRSWSVLGGQMVWAQLERAVNIFSWFSKRKGWWVLTLQRMSMLREQTTSLRDMKGSSPRAIFLISALLVLSLFFLRQKSFLVCSSSSRVRLISFCRFRYSSFLGLAFWLSVFTIFRGSPSTMFASSSTLSCPKQVRFSQGKMYFLQSLLR